jgi:hypothetical protein
MLSPISNDSRQEFIVIVLTFPWQPPRVPATEWARRSDRGRHGWEGTERRLHLLASSIAMGVISDKDFTSALEAGALFEACSIIGRGQT